MKTDESDCPIFGQKACGHFVQANQTRVVGEMRYTRLAAWDTHTQTHSKALIIFPTVWDEHLPNLNMDIPLG